jgi:predicted metal-binding membrane protein
VNLVHPSPVAAGSRRDRYLISLCLAAITALAWAYLIHLARHPSSDQEYARMMAAMGMVVDRPWTTVDAFLTFAMWTVMMVGMMAGSAAPMLLLFAGAQRGRDTRRVPLAVVMFGLGYLAIWAGFSAVATFTQWALQRAALMAETMTVSKGWLAAAILIVAGIYQLTPLKGACLTLCRSPLGFFMTNWRDGTLGAFRMGTRHGMFCLGCCWALMIVLFAVGIMNLAWVAALTVLVLIEKITPAGVMLSRLAGVAMIGVGVYVLVSQA